ncbi:MAG TPA: hydrogenase maturation nickel metallochaperone HypA [Phototrophicaceae bacterium]|nr:hydrogenase maturation nickel metallochaperone HypA [Phototrophicaceae bacterium]
MHELSITQGILQLALDRAEGARRITDVYLVVGQLSSVVDDSVQFYWDIVSAGTIAEKSRLHFHRIPAVMECRSCHQQYNLDGDHLACPVCGGSAVRLIAGDEFYLDCIDVEIGAAEQVQS